MKTKTLFLLTVICFISFNSLYAQKLTAKQKEKEQNKVKIFTSEENDNLQRFYHEEVDKMKLPNEDKEKYYDILLYHTYDMSRLDDKDKDYTETEITQKFNVILDKMNAKMKALLTPSQYIMHLEIFGKIVYSVNRKRDMKKNKE